MIRLPLSAISAFAAVAPFMAKADENYALTGALLRGHVDGAVLESSDRHAVARYHLDRPLDAADYGIAEPLWIPGDLVEWVAAQKPWRPKKEASPEWWALHEIVIGQHGDRVVVNIIRQGDVLLATKTSSVTFDWGSRFPNVAAEFAAQPGAPASPARPVDLWTVEKVAAWARRWLAQGPGKHPKMPPMSIYARTTNAGHRTIIDVGALVVVALPEGRILK